MFVPTQGSFLVWKHLFRTGIGAGMRCLDVGCGCGIQTVQLALNGAEHVHAIDIDRNAIANTVSNAYRNGVGDRVSGDDVDLYQWTTEDRYDLIVASLFQMPVDPYEEPSGHRPLDYWGRNQLDHFLSRLPKLLTADGRALIMQLSIVGQVATVAAARARRPQGARRRLHVLPVRPAVRGQQAADRARRADLRRLPPEARGRRRHGRLPDRGQPPG